MREGYAPVVEAFTGGVEVALFVAFSLVLVWIVVSTVRRLIGSV